MSEKALTTYGYVHPQDQEPAAEALLIAEEVASWLRNESYRGQYILHSIIRHDAKSRRNFTVQMAKLIEAVLNGWTQKDNSNEI
jgi:hypothetical protein